MAELEREEVIRLKPSQREKAAGVLLKAFLDDPVYSYVFPNRSERTRSLRVYWNAILKFALVCGEVYATSTVSGVACWLPPIGLAPTLWSLLRCGFAPTRATLGFNREAQVRLAALVRYQEDVKKRLGLKNFWYLGLLGVDPAQQHRGIGGRLLQPKLLNSDIERLSCYLETESASNVRFYERYGFSVAEASVLPGTDLRTWVMTRQPCPALDSAPGSSGQGR